MRTYARKRNHEPTDSKKGPKMGQTETAEAEVFQDNEDPSPFSSYTDMRENGNLSLKQKTAADQKETMGKKNSKRQPKRKRPSKKKKTRNGSALQTKAKQKDTGRTQKARSRKRTESEDTEFGVIEKNKNPTRKSIINNREEESCTESRVGEDRSVAESTSKKQFEWEDDQDDDIEVFRKEENFTWQQKMDLLLPKMFGHAWKGPAVKYADDLNLSVEEIQVNVESSSEENESDDAEDDDGDEDDKYTYVWTTATQTNTVPSKTAGSDLTIQSKTRHSSVVPGTKITHTDQIEMYSHPTEAHSHQTEAHSHQNEVHSHGTEQPRTKYSVRVNSEKEAPEEAVSKGKFGQPDEVKAGPFKEPKRISKGKQSDTNGNRGKHHKPGFPISSTPVRDHVRAEPFTQDLSSIHRVNRWQLEQTPKSSTFCKPRTPQKNHKFTTLHTQPLHSTALFVSQRYDVGEAVTQDISPIAAGLRKHPQVEDQSPNLQDVPHNTSPLPTCRNNILTSTPTSQHKIRGFKGFDMDLSSVQVVHEELQPDQSTVINSMEIAPRDDDVDDTLLRPPSYQWLQDKSPAKDTDVNSNQEQPLEVVNTAKEMRDKQVQYQTGTSYSMKQEMQNKTILTDITNIIMRSIVESCPGLTAKESTQLQEKLCKIQEILTDKERGSVGENVAEETVAECARENEIVPAARTNETEAARNCIANSQGSISDTDVVQEKENKCSSVSIANVLSNKEKLKRKHTSSSTMSGIRKVRLQGRGQSTYQCDEGGVYCDLGNFEMIPEDILRNWPRKKVKILKRHLPPSKDFDIQRVGEDVLTMDICPRTRKFPVVH